MDRRERGRREYAGLIGGTPEENLAKVRSRSPSMYDALVEGGFAGTLANAELARVDREIATVAVLAALGGAEPQLASHTRAALRLGTAPSELRALCEHVALYAGFPRALNALAVLDGVLTDAGIAAPAGQRRVTLADHETLVASRGERGPAVLLVHSLGVDWRMWEPVLDRLEPGRRVFAYDVRGHGSAAGAPVPYTMADSATDLLAVLDELGLDRAHVVGLSLGGAIAQTAAVREPHRFASLALLTTTDQPFTEAFEERARAAETSGLAAARSAARCPTLRDGPCLGELPGAGCRRPARGAGPGTPGGCRRGRRRRTGRGRGTRRPRSPDARTVRAGGPVLVVRRRAVPDAPWPRGGTAPRPPTGAAPDDRPGSERPRSNVVTTVLPTMPVGIDEKIPACLACRADTSLARLARTTSPGMRNRPDPLRPGGRPPARRSVSGPARPAQVGAPA